MAETLAERLTALCDACERAFTDYVTDGVNETPAMNEMYRQARDLRAAAALTRPVEREALARALRGLYSPLLMRAGREPSENNWLADADAVLVRLAEPQGTEGKVDAGSPTEVPLPDAGTARDDPNPIPLVAPDVESESMDADQFERYIAPLVHTPVAPSAPPPSAPSEALLPCPFCGGHEQADEFEPGIVRHAIHAALGCPAIGKHSIVAWTRRVAPVAPEPSDEDAARWKAFAEDAFVSVNDADDIYLAAYLGFDVGSLARATDAERAALSGYRKVYGVKAVTRLWDAARERARERT